MTSPSIRPFATWFLVLTAILVALGAQTLLEALVPASIANMEFGFPDKTVIHRAGGAQFVVAESIIRFISFLLGGFVGGRVAIAVRTRLLVLLAMAAAVTTLFQQLPGTGPMLWWAPWASAAPCAISIGAYMAQPTQNAA